MAWSEAENYHHTVIKSRGTRAAVHPRQVIMGDVSGCELGVHGGIEQAHPLDSSVFRSSKQNPVWIPDPGPINGKSYVQRASST